jgi:hypothetical protein
MILPVRCRVLVSVVRAGLPGKTVQFNSMPNRFRGNETKDEEEVYGVYEPSFR